MKDEHLEIIKRVYSDIYELARENILNQAIRSQVHNPLISTPNVASSYMICRGVGSLFYDTSLYARINFWPLLVIFLYNSSPFSIVKSLVVLSFWFILCTKSEYQNETRAYCAN